MNISRSLGLLSFLFEIVGCGSAPYTKTTGGAPIVAKAGETHTYNFDSYAVGKIPGDFEAILGDWVVAASDKGNLARQSGMFGDGDFPRVVVRQLTFLNPHVKVRCKPESGGADRACGLMFRFQDSDNYYITRANALENNVRLYFVKGGVRTMFANADLAVTSGAWHTLEAFAQGGDFKIAWDGQQIIAAHDETFKAAGKVGLWTKADSVTAFDDLEATEQ